jgi:sec-independent protein translocase protein TatB
MFFNIGGGEILVIALVALIAVGPEQLPSLLRKIGSFLGQARAVTTNLRDEFMSSVDDVSDVADPNRWMGSGADDDPVVPRGYAGQQRSTDPAQKRSSDPAQGRSTDPTVDESSDGDDGEDKPPVNQIAAANAMRSAEASEPPGSTTGVDEVAEPESDDEPSDSSGELGDVAGDSP